MNLLALYIFKDKNNYLFKNKKIKYHEIRRLEVG